MQTSCAPRGLGSSPPAPVSEEDLIRTAVKIVPLSRTMNEQINHIRAWAFERAVRASLRGRGQAIEPQPKWCRPSFFVVCKPCGGGPRCRERRVKESILQPARY